MKITRSMNNRFQQRQEQWRTKQRQQSMDRIQRITQRDKEERIFKLCESCANDSRHHPNGDYDDICISFRKAVVSGLCSSYMNAETMQILSKSW